MSARGVRRPEIALGCALALACALAPLITAPSGAATAGWRLPPPNDLDLGAVLSPPSLRHWLGTDSLGRDLLSRLLSGGRASLAVGIGASLISLLVGGLLGLAAGLMGGWIDLCVGRLIEAAFCLPALIVLLAAGAAGLGKDPLALALILGLTRWVEVAVIARSEALRWRSTPRRDGAQASGAGAARLLVRHVGPAAFPLLATASALVAAQALMVEAGAGALGFGIEPPRPTWGGLLLDARLTLDEAWWPAVFPGLAIFLAVAGLLRVAERAGVPPLYSPPRAERARAEGSR